MENLNNFILEKLKITKDTKINSYKYHPKSYSELRNLLLDLINERGKNANLNDIDVSDIKLMTGLFGGKEFIKLQIENINISEWDVSNVIEMNSMFRGQIKFNCDLSKWDVSKVKDMSFMFFDCMKFTGKGLENWKIDNLLSTTDMFYNTYSLKNRHNLLKKFI